MYFWQKPLDQLIQNNFFTRLLRYVVVGTGTAHYVTPIFCTLLMFALYKDKTARFVNAPLVLEGDLVEFGWVEFQHRGVRYAVNPGCLGNNGLPLPACTVFLLPELLDAPSDEFELIDYQQFWDLPPARRLNYELRSPDTSTMWWELMYVLWDEPKLLKLVDETLAQLKEGNNPKAYKLPLAGTNYAYPLDQRVMDTLADAKLSPEAALLKLFS